MQLILFNTTGSPITFLSGVISVAGGGNTAVTNTVQQLSLATDGALRSNILSGNIYITDGTNNFGSTDAINYLYELVQNLGPLSDGSGNLIGSDTGNPGVQYLRTSTVQSIVASTNNSSTANLTTNSSFTGAFDISLGQSAIEINFISDQPSTIQVQQSSDSTHWDIIDTYFTYANRADARTFASIAFYWRVIVTNTGMSTSTIFRLQSALIPIANVLPKSLSQSGNLNISINETTPFGPNSTQLFDDTYDIGLDITNRWNTPIASGGGVSATTNTPGDTALGTGTTANGYSILTSQPTFQQVAPGWLVYLNAINLEFPITLNTYRFWGLGTPNVTPTAVAPLSNAIGFELTTSGKLFVVSYSSGSRLIIQDLSTSTGNSSQPLDTLIHKYFIWFRGDKAFFAIDEIGNQVAFMRTGATGPTVNKLPSCMLAIAGSTPPSSSGVLTSNALWIGDTSSSSNQISDGVFPWRKVTVNPNGGQLVSIDSSYPTATQAQQLFDDTYSTSSTLDTVNRWSAPVSSGGGVLATVPSGGGDVALGTGTTANGYSILTSQPTFQQEAPGFIVVYNAINLEFPITLNTYRFWGLGTTPTTPTAVAPLIDAVGFEVSTAGKLYAITYAGSTRNIIADLSSSTGNSAQPKDSSVHKYYIYFRGDLCYWSIDTPGNVVATMLTGIAGPVNNTLPIKMLAIAGSTAPGSSGVLTSNAVWVGETTNSSQNISDGLFAWRKATIKPQGSLNLTSDNEFVVRAIPVDGTKASFSASVTGLATTANATDFFTITGSATKTIRVTYLEITGTTAGLLGGQTADFLLIKRSTANGTNGGPTTRTNVPHDSLSGAGTAVVRTFSGNPTLGTPVGQLRAQRIDLPLAGNISNPIIWDFGRRPSQAIVLRGTGDVLAINLNGVSLTTPLLDISIEWSEE